MLQGRSDNLQRVLTDLHEPPVTHTHIHTHTLMDTHGDKDIIIFAAVGFGDTQRGQGLMTELSLLALSVPRAVRDLSTSPVCPLGR